MLERDTVSRIHLAIFLQLNLQMTYIDIIMISTIYYFLCPHRHTLLLIVVSTMTGTFSPIKML